MINTLHTLKEAGFFKDFAHLNDDELLMDIHEKRRQFYSHIFGYDYEPERALSDHKLATRDAGKMFCLDLEADVCRENKVYSSLLERIDEASGKPGIVTAIEEAWESETGPVRVRCKINGEAKEYRPEYHNDWIDQSILERMLADVSAVVKEQFHLCLGPNLEWFGQDVTYIRLKAEERKILQEQLGWQFHDDFLSEMNR